MPNCQILTNYFFVETHLCVTNFYFWRNNKEVTYLTQLVVFMKKSLSLGIMCVVLFGATVNAPAAHALSCLPTADYLDSIIDNGQTIVFIGTSLERTDTDSYTSEVVKVTEALQGYVEEELFVYHQKHPDWNYLCNAGPQANGSTGLYVVERDTLGQYNVSQRLTLTEPIATDFRKEITDTGVEGMISELTATDQQNQIYTILSELFQRMSKLLTELKYWQSR